MREAILINGIGNDEPLPNINIYYRVIRSITDSVQKRIKRRVEKCEPTWIANRIIWIGYGRVGSGICVPLACLEPSLINHAETAS